MRLMRAVLWFLLCGAFLGFATTFALESSYRARAQKVQIVRIDKTKRSPLGPETVEVGEPVIVILDDPSAFLKNKTAIGLPMVDADYLESHSGAALQIDTVESVIGLARLGSFLAFLAAILGLFLMSRIQTVLPPEP
jgi:hypothetical protein